MVAHLRLGFPKARICFCMGESEWEELAVVGGKGVAGRVCAELGTNEAGEGTQYFCGFKCCCDAEFNILRMYPSAGNFCAVFSS
jgi:hypothetical protein